MSYNPLDSPNVGGTGGFHDWASRIKDMQKAPPRTPGDVYYDSKVTIYSSEDDADEGEFGSWWDYYQFRADPEEGVFIRGSLTVNGDIIEEGALANPLIVPIVMEWDGSMTSTHSGPTIQSYYQDSDGLWHDKSTGDLTFKDSAGTVTT